MVATVYFKPKISSDELIEKGRRWHWLLLLKDFCQLEPSWARLPQPASHCICQSRVTVIWCQLHVTQRGLLPLPHRTTAAHSTSFRRSIRYALDTDVGVDRWTLRDAAEPAEVWSTGQTPAATSFPLAWQLLITQLLRCHKSLFLLTLSLSKKKKNTRNNNIPLAKAERITVVFVERGCSAAHRAAVTLRDHISILWKTQHHSWCPAPGGLYPDTRINSKWQLCHAKVYNLDVHGAVGGRPLYNQVWGLHVWFQKELR